MPNESTTASGASSPGAPLGAEERARLIRSVLALAAEIREGSMLRPRMPAPMRAQLLERQRALLKEYFQRLPVVTMGRCPVCDAALDSSFDPWGLDGFWWQESMSGEKPEPRACPHFRVLTGALNLNGLPPVGGEAEAHPGPAVPYVIPKVLQLPTMVAVVQEVKMKNGYTAYPVSYFSAEKPSALLLANPWTRQSASYRTPDGQSGFGYKTDPWDFDLPPWVGQGKLRWIEPGDRDHKLSPRMPVDFPFANLPGARLRQIIVRDKLLTAPPPNNETVNPFTD